MRKVTSILFVLLFSLSLYAQQSLVQTENLKSQEMIQKKEAEVARLQALQEGTKIQEAKTYPITFKGVQKLNTVSAEEIYWTNDFEGDVSAWQNVDLLANPEAYTHISDFNAWDGNSWWCGTETDSWTGYGNSWNQVLTTMEAIDLSSAGSASFDFMMAHETEADWDFIYVQASTDGEAWTTLESFTGIADWAEYSIDLADYTGGEVWVRLLFASDGSYSDEDGLNPTDFGAYQADDFYVVVDGAETLLDDAGDTVTGMEAGLPASPGAYWTLVDTEAASGTHSFQTQNYVSDALFALVSEEVDLSDIVAGSSIFVDFQVNAQGLHMEEAAFGDEDFYYIEVSGDGGESWAGVNNFGYQNTSGWTSWRGTTTGNTEISEYLGGTVMFRWVFHANTVGKDAASETAGVYIDDPVVLVISDPYEPNNTPATATEITFPFESEGALLAPGDADFYTFTVGAGEWVNIYLDNTNVDAEILLASLDAGGSPSLWFIPDDPNGAYYADWVPYDQIFINTYSAGNYVMRVRLAQGADDAGEYKLYAYSPQLAPDFTAISDIPNDQGLQVRASYDHSEFADPLMIPWQARVEKYHFERRSGLSTWDHLRTVPIVLNGTNNTNAVLPTLADDVATTFKIIAETNLSTSMVHAMYQGAFPWMEAPRTLYERGFKYGSDVAAGTSVDNIDPIILGAGAERVAEGVKVYWEADAPDLFRYTVRRSEVSGQEGEVIFSTENIQTTSYIDTEADKDYFYVVEVHDDGNNVVQSKELNPSITSVDGDAGIPNEYSLGQNYPNPFNPATTIKFGLPMSANVSIKVYDILGQEVAQLVNSSLTAGFHNINFDASNLNSGMYIYRIEATGLEGGNFVDTKKMLLVK